jgi:hypothetical protein
MLIMVTTEQPHYRISVQLEKFEVGGEKESMCSSN